MPASRCYVSVKRFIHDFGDNIGDPGGTPLLNFNSSAGLQDLQPTTRDSQGEPPIPGPKNAEQNLDQGNKAFFLGVRVTRVGCLPVRHSKSYAALDYERYLKRGS